MSWTFYPASEFPHHRDRWQRFNFSEAASPLLDQAFITPLLQEFGSGKEILACYEPDNQLQAIGILAPKNPFEWETFQPSQAPLGVWMQRRDTHLPRAFSRLLKQLPGFSLGLGITQQDPDLVPRPQDSATLTTLDYIHTARISIQGNFADYWRARGRNLRHNLKKQKNKLAKEGIHTRLHITTAAQDVAQAICDYGDLESAGWKAEHGTAIHPQNAQGRFYRTMLEAFCRRGQGRIYRYFYNDRIVAMDLCVEGKGSLFILKTTYDESLQDGTSPALLMRQEAFEQLFDQGKLKRIEFYGKAMDWNSRWCEEMRTIYHMNQYRWPTLIRLRNLIKKTMTL